MTTTKAPAWTRTSSEQGEQDQQYHQQSNHPPVNGQHAENQLDQQCQKNHEQDQLEHVEPPDYSHCVTHGMTERERKAYKHNAVAILQMVTVRDASAVLTQAQLDILISLLEMVRDQATVTFEDWCDANPENEGEVEELERVLRSIDPTSP